MRTAIFDLNGIFIQSPKLSGRFEQAFGVPPEKFLPKLSEIMDKVRRPNAGRAFAYWEPVLTEWGIKLSEQEFWDFWFGAEKVSMDMADFARSLRGKGIKSFILSNNFKERADYYDQHSWTHEIADKIYYSWQTGFVKPDTRAWTNILQENNLRANDCVYFDDKEENLQAARSVGIEAHLFASKEAAEKLLLS
jgi:putative hydrolase of the HAD superfamily